MSSKSLLPRLKLYLLRFGVLLGLLLAWHFLTFFRVLDPFFFATPLSVLRRIFDEFVSGAIYYHLWITLIEAVLAFVIGSVSGLIIGFWFARSPGTS